jgi:predicted transcriptional regulator
MTLAAKLKELRLQKGYTQTDLANKLKVNLRIIQRYERDMWPPHDKLLKLNKIFKYDFSRHIYDNKTTKR